MTSPLGFKARVGSALFALGRGVHVTCFLRFISGATPLLVYNASIAASRLPHTHVSAEVGFLRSFEVPILSKIEITIDFNGHEAQLYYSNTQK